MKRFNEYFNMVFVVWLCFAWAVPDALSQTPDFPSTVKRMRFLQQEYDRLNTEVDNKYKDNFTKIQQEYYYLINKIDREIPDPPKPKDLFETQNEYIARIQEYKKNLAKFESNKKARIKKIKQDYNLRYYMSVEEVDLLKEKISLTGPVIKELEAIQHKKRVLDDEPVQVILFEPEPEKFRFPIHFIMGDDRFQKHWTYKSRERAREFWNNRSFLRAEKLVQVECAENGSIREKFTGFRVSNPRTGDTREFMIEKPGVCKEVSLYYEMKDEALPAAELMVALKDVVKGPAPDMNFIFISPRTFMMGSPRNEIGRWADETQHKVKLTRGFYIQTTEVTQGQWRYIMGNNPSYFSRCGSDCPVENVYWGDAMQFIARLNKKEGTDKYRLPTEAEWEFAARAGSTGTWTFGNNEEQLGDYAWFKDNSGGAIHPVAQLKPSAWGLYDMHGNVSEWCSDWFGPYPSREVTDPRGPYSGKFRVARGGNWYFTSRGCRSADRNQNLPGDKSEKIGFRVVKSP